MSEEISTDSSDTKISTESSDTKSSDTNASSDEDRQSGMLCCIVGSPRKSPTKKSSSDQQSPKSPPVAPSPKSPPVALSPKSQPVALTAYHSISPDQACTQAPPSPEEEPHVRQLEFPSKEALATAQAIRDSPKIQVVAEVHRSDVPVKVPERPPRRSPRKKTSRNNSGTSPGKGSSGKSPSGKSSNNYKPEGLEFGNMPSNRGASKSPCEYLSKSPTSLFKGNSPPKTDTSKVKSSKSIFGRKSPKKTDPEKSTSPKSIFKGNSPQKTDAEKSTSPKSIFKGNSPQNTDPEKSTSPKSIFKGNSPQNTDPGKPPVGPSPSSSPNKGARSNLTIKSLATPRSPPDDELTRYRSKSDPGQPRMSGEFTCHSIESVESSTYRSSVSSCGNAGCSPWACRNPCPEASVGDIITKCAKKLSPKRSAADKSPEREGACMLPERSRALKSPQRSHSAGSADRRRASKSPERSENWCSPERRGAFGSPERSGACGLPERSGACGSPERSGACGSPERSSACGSPERRGACGSPERSGACGSPERGEQGLSRAKIERETSPGKIFKKRTSPGKTLCKIPRHMGPVLKRCYHAKRRKMRKKRSISFNDDEIEVIEAEAADGLNVPRLVLRPVVKCLTCKKMCRFKTNKKQKDGDKMKLVDVNSDWSHVWECHEGRVARAVCYNLRGPGHQQELDEWVERRPPRPRGHSLSCLTHLKWLRDCMGNRDDDEDDDQNNASNQVGSAWYIPPYKNK